MWCCTHLTAFQELIEEISRYAHETHTPKEYQDYVRYLFEAALKVKEDDPVQQLLNHLEKETNFYTAPASTRFHGSGECGLVRHSLAVTANGMNLQEKMFPAGVNLYFLVIACLFHDLCKVNMYETKLRNVKNEKTGKWEKEPYYKIREDYLSYGHGVESMLRLNKYVAMPEAWNQAIRWHIGAYDLSPFDKYALEKALAAYPEVLFLQTVDMQAGVVEVI